MRQVWANIGVGARVSIFENIFLWEMKESVKVLIRLPDARPLAHALYHTSSIHPLPPPPPPPTTARGFVHRMKDFERQQTLEARRLVHLNQAESSFVTRRARNCINFSRPSTIATVYCYVDGPVTIKKIFIVSSSGSYTHTGRTQAAENVHQIWSWLKDDSNVFIVRTLTYHRSKSAKLHIRPIVSASWENIFHSLSSTIGLSQIMSLLSMVSEHQT